MDRVQLGQQGTVSASWERDGAGWDPGTTIVSVVNDSAGAVLLSGQATTGSGGSRSFTLPLSVTGTLDKLTLLWTASDGSVLTTYAEVVGGFLFSVAQARRRSPLQDSNYYPTDQVLWYRTLAEQALEAICGVAFVPRYRRDTARVVGYGMLEVDRRNVTNVRTVYTQTNSGPVALQTLTGLRIQPGGLIYVPNIWNWYSQPIQVVYESGYPETPYRVSRAAVELARRWMVESPWDERMTAFKSREGGEIDILTATGSAFDIPEVVAVAEQYGTPMIA